MTAGPMPPNSLRPDEGRETRMTAEDAVAALNALDVSDPERAHRNADDILLAAASPSVRAAYRRVSGRAAWWGCG